MRLLKEIVENAVEGQRQHYKDRLTTGICFPQPGEARSGKPGTTRYLRFYIPGA
jgi:hypothetical protein